MENKIRTLDDVYAKLNPYHKAENMSVWELKNANNFIEAQAKDVVDLVYHALQSEDFENLQLEDSARAKSMTIFAKDFNEFSILMGKYYQERLDTALDAENKKGG